MLSKPNDTNKDAENFQISLLRKASIAQRIHSASFLSATTRSLSRRAILRANPRLSKQDINIIFVDLHYGSKIAKRLEKYLDSKK